MSTSNLTHMKPNVLSVLIYKTEILIVSIHKVVLRIKWLTMCKPLRKMLVHSGCLVNVGYFFFLPSSFPTNIFLLMFHNRITYLIHQAGNHIWLLLTQLWPLSSHFQITLRAGPDLHSHCHVLSQTLITSQLNYCKILLRLTLSVVSSSSNSPPIILWE